MPINRKTGLGSITVSDNAIANLTGTVVSECYGVVGVTAKNLLKDGFNDLLKKDNISKGIIVRNKKGVLDIDIYIVASYGVRISEVVLEIQKRVKYTIEKTLNVDINEINVYVEGVKVI